MTLYKYYDQEPGFDRISRVSTTRTLKRAIGVTVEDDAIVCAGSVLRPGITVGARSVIGMGAVVTKDVLADTVVYGNPAQAKYTKEIYKQKKAEWEKE